MRLSKLKLAGFKTFVDPTTVLFPGNLVGVVGPNGCGKSNVIDAVRWVLGESRASALRGESMQDVIFNGSGTRKPVSRASVELVFDNSAGRASGQWSRYAEISVKRVLDRNGESSYHINQVHVRRKDVVDLFLGTGLGPRAYAIIEQGMISRIIEARPEEIRGFLEEAAGVTRYRERRRETEGRLADARDNLARLDDIRMELGERIEHLAGQAELAERYRALRDAHTERQDLLWLLKRTQAEKQGARLEAELAETGRRVEADSARLQELERVVEAGREAHLAASDEVQAAQSELYAAASEVSRLESEARRLGDARERIARRQAELQRDDAHWEQRAAGLAEERVRWQQLLENARGRAAEADARHRRAAGEVPELEQMAGAAATTTQAVRRELAQAEQQLRVQEAHRTSARRALDALVQRRERIFAAGTAPEAPDPKQIDALERECDRLGRELSELEAGFATLQGELPRLQAEQRGAVEAERGAQKALTETRARRDALLHLQARVGQQGDLGAWLRRHQLDHAVPLWQRISVEPGWEAAVESVLRERLTALRVDGIEQLGGLIADPPPVSGAVVWETPGRAIDRPACPDGARRLRELATARDAAAEVLLDHWLVGFAAVEDLAEWQARAARLAPGIRLVGRDGQLLDALSLTRYVPDSRTHGVIERQREIDALVQALAPLESTLEQSQQEVREAERLLAARQQSAGELRRDLQQRQQHLHARQLALLRITQERQRAEEHARRLAHDLEELSQAEARERRHHDDAERELAAAGQLVEQLGKRLEAAAGAQQQRDELLRQARNLESSLARELQEQKFAERECSGKLEDNARNRDLAEEQQKRLASERAALQVEHESCDDSATRAALQQALALRGTRETVLSGVRDRLAEITGRLKEDEALRLAGEHEAVAPRERLAELRLELQAVQLAIAQYDERLVESGADPARLAPLLAGDPKEASLAREVARLARELGELGAVNLAAVEELASARERKAYLDAQNEDLRTAIETLEGAIQRIDRETREQLQATHDFVDRHFGELFPQLFGGGQARLVLTGDEILDAGVQIVAQPPGKKNASIHLLSGGEKTLTAIALVFSMFQLNPAPFCMLDEVDAPLDDTNTERYGAMVRRMSAQTQFVFITHNKITMEIARQLVGVTMQEQGVSRLVEVDIEEALRMADRVPA